MLKEEIISFIKLRIKELKSSIQEKVEIFKINIKNNWLNIFLLILTIIISSFNVIFLIIKI